MDYVLLNLGLGESPGDQLTLKFSDWFDDCRAAIEVAAEEDPDSGVVLVGSSMGAWISIKKVEKFQHLVKGLVLIAPAINFMWSFYLVSRSSIDWLNQEFTFDFSSFHDEGFMST